MTLTSAGGRVEPVPGGAPVRVPRVLGHRDTNSTACPGSALYAQLADLRARVATGEPLPGFATLTSAGALAPRRTTYGRSVARERHARPPTRAQPLAGLPVRLQVLRGGALAHAHGR